MRTNKNMGRKITAFKLLALTSTALVGMPLSTPAAAADWTGGVSNDWFTAGNWSTGAVPAAGDDVSINSNSPAPAVDGANAQANTVVVGDSAIATLLILNTSTLSSDQGLLGNLALSHGIVGITGASATWTNSGDLTVGNFGDGTLSIFGNGSASNANGLIGAQTGSTGTATVDGAGSTWTNNGILTVGGSGDGTLNIITGGAVTNAGTGIVGDAAGSTGTVIVDGAGSTWTNNADLVLGAHGGGTLNISNGGVVSDTWGYLGESAGSTGAVTVDGSASSWTSSLGITVGVDGIGALTISNGGAVSTGVSYIGDNADSTGTVTVSGAGSTWANSADLLVGVGASGTLTISNGGAVSNLNGLLGFDMDAAGTATVTGAGSTWTNSGTLHIGGDGAGALTILNGGMVVNTQGVLGLGANSTGVATVDGVGSSWTNAGGLVVGDAGTGTLRISAGGAVSNAQGVVGNSFIGTVEVDGAGSTWSNSSDLTVGLQGRGTLAVTNGGAVSNAVGTIGDTAGSVGIVSVGGAGSSWTSTSNVYIGYNGAGSLTVSDDGTASSAGDFVIAASTISTGVLNIGGAAGSAAAASGTLNGSTVRFGDGVGTLNFNHTNSAYAFAPIIDGLDGTINQIAGTTNLTANSSGFLGATNVLGGRLAVNGSLAGSLVTVYGGMLGGNGTVGGVVAQAGGIIAPGNSIGTLNVAGNVTQASGSVYQVELTSTGTSDLVHATGTATIASGALIDVVKLDAAPYVVGTHYMVLQADGGITGTYTLTGDIGTPFLGLVDSYDANHLYLDLVQRTFAQVGLTPNQKAAGGAAENLGAGNPLYDGLVVLPTAAIAQAAFDQISGEIHGSAKTAMIEDSRFLREAAMDRLRLAFGETTAGTRNDEAGSDDHLGVWSRGFGSFGQWHGDGNAATMTRNTGGLFIGADGAVGDNWRLGVIGGYDHSSYGVGERNSTASSDDYHFGLYGGTELGNLAFRSGLAYTWRDIDTHRAVAFPGFANTLTGDYGAGTTQAFGELGYRLKVEDVTLEPFANFAYVNLATGGFSEAGGTGALDVAASSSNTAFTTLGLRASTNFTLDNGATMTVRGMIGWRHAFGDTTPTSDMAFPGGSAFTIAGAPMVQDTAIVDLGLDLTLTPSATLGLAYGSQFGARAVDQTIKGTLNVKF